MQMLKRIRLCFYAVFRFYNEGFRNMTWGRQLWLLILIKLFILFVVLRIFFFQPYYGGMSNEQRESSVATELTVRGQ